MVSKNIVSILIGVAINSSLLRNSKLAKVVILITGG